MKQNQFTNEYQQLAIQINNRRKQKGLNKLTKLQISQRQEKLVNSLLEKEEVFKKLIFTFPEGNEAYFKFLNEIIEVNKNILTAKPYFREVAKTFYQKISGAIRDRDIMQLQTFHINFRFIKFIMDNWEGNVPKTVKQAHEDILALRAEIVEDNLPLVLNRAMRHFRKVKRHHLTLLDMINICTCGLTSGVDKWVGPYRSVFLSVCIGRMTGDLIKSTSETTLYFYPNDRRVLYHANLLKSREGIEDFEKIAERLVEKPELKNLKLTKSGIVELLSASSVISADGNLGDEDEDFNVYSYTKSNEKNPEELLEEMDGHTTLMKSMGDLSVMESKVLKLKGIHIPKHKEG